MKEPIVVSLKLAAYEPPVFKPTNGSKYVRLGKDDKWAQKLIDLRGLSAKHNAIIRGKVGYIMGGGFEATDPLDATAQQWLKSINGAGETLNDVAERCADDMETFGGFYLHLIKDKLGRIAEVYHYEFRLMRASADLQTFYYKNDWKAQGDPKEFPAFNPKGKKSGIYYFFEYTPGFPIYPVPTYHGALNAIEADGERGRHTLNNAKTGFSASKMINFFNGQPPTEEKKKMETGLHDKFTGADGVKLFVTFNDTKDDAPTILDLGPSDLTKEDPTPLNKLISEDIYSGHSITSPILFGIKEEGQLGGVGELRTAYGIFNATYVNGKRKKVERVFNHIARMKGLVTDLQLIEVDPVGIAIPDSMIEKVLSGEEARAALGFSGSIPPGVVTPSLSPEQKFAEGVNDHLKSLTGKQHQQMMRVLRQYDKGQLSRERAALMLKTSYGLSDEEVNDWLGSEEPQQFSTDLDETAVAQLFSEVGHDRTAFDILSSRKLDAETDKDAHIEELNFRLSFAEEKQKEQTTVAVAPAVKLLYSYEKRPEASGPAVIETTRPFCKKLLSLDRLYTRQQIELISQKLGYSVFNRGGGFWGSKPYCRHEWRLNVVIDK